MKTGTKHQNKTKTTGKKKKTEEKEKSSKYKENQRGENTCWKKSFSIFMPKLTEHNSTNQDPHSNQDYLSKYRNLKEIQSVKPKMSKKNYQYECYKGRHPFSKSETFPCLSETSEAVITDSLCWLLCPQWELSQYTHDAEVHALTLHSMAATQWGTPSFPARASEQLQGCNK